MTATTIKLRRSSTANSIPTTGSLASGEVALNTRDGKLFFKKTVDTTDSIVTLQPFPDGGTAGQYLSLNSSGDLIWIDKPETITYLATSISMPNPSYGTYNSGSVTDITTYGDYTIGHYYSVNDTASAPAFIVDIGFTGVVQFNRVVMSLAYTNSSSHVVYVEIYNYETDNWDIVSQYTGLTGWAQFNIGIITSVPYISSGVVTVRVYHNSFGNTAHETKFDYIALEDSTQGGQGPKGDRGATGATGATGNAGPSFKTIQVAGQANLVAVTDDTLTITAGSGIILSTSNTAPKTLTITSTGGGGSSASPIKTFNIVGTFGLLTGTARFFPIVSDTIRSVILTTSSIVTSDLTAGLYLNGQFVQFFTISAGQSYASYTSLNILIQPGEAYTVNIVAGNSTNFTMALYNINL
jgi:hypothetical protein